MNITSAQYTRNIEDTENENIKATIDDVVMFVPLSPDNRHFLAIQEWAKIEGNTIQEAE
tara:strand:- start:485 stop:661 length:177 start_codon:yes stop_codon:yes gene_type:complete